MKKSLIYIMAGLLSIGFSSCSEDFFEESPESYISPEQLSTSSAANLGVLKGIYASLRSYGISGAGGHEDYGHKSMLSISDLMGNDVTMASLNWNGFYYNFSGRKVTHSRSKAAWFTYYIQIKNANIVINSIDPVTASNDLKYIRAQALALRGYLHFMLARFYAPTYVGNEDSKCIPLNTGEISKFRNTNIEVYTQISKDLEEAVIGLDGFVRDNNEFIDQSVAQGMLADVYLEMGNFMKAAIFANKARQKYALLNEEDWKNGFYNIEQDETMWGADLNAELNTWVANFFSHFDNTNTGYANQGIGIDKRLYEAIPSTDYRKSVFMGAVAGKFDEKDGINTVDPEASDYKAYVSFKFRDLTTDRNSGDYIYMRSSLMYYIEAEALAKSGNEPQAQAVLFEITSQRDSGYVQSVKTGIDLIDEIILQKRIELYGEGFAFFDMKRLHKGIKRDYPNSNHGEFGKFNFGPDSPEFILQIPEAEIDVTGMEQNP